MGPLAHNKGAGDIYGVCPHLSIVLSLNTSSCEPNPISSSVSLFSTDLYEQRREVGKDVERRPTAIYLYGVDVMSTKEVLSYFSEYGPVFVEWLDDSSCEPSGIGGSPLAEGRGLKEARGKLAVHAPNLALEYQLATLLEHSGCTVSAPVCVCCFA